MVVCGKRIDIGFLCSAVERLLGVGDGKWNDRPYSHPGESDECQLWQRHCWQEDVSERFGCKHWQYIGQYQPGERIEQPVLCVGVSDAAVPARRPVQQLSSFVQS